MNKHTHFQVPVPNAWKPISPSNPFEGCDPQNLGCKIEACIVDLRREGRHLPLKRSIPDPFLADDETIIAALDHVVIAAWIRHTPAQDLRRDPWRSLLVSGARAIGVNNAPTTAPTLSDLRAALRAAAPQGANNAEHMENGPSDVASLLNMLIRIEDWTRLPDSTRLDAVFRHPGLLKALGDSVTGRFSTCPQTRDSLLRALGLLQVEAERLITERALPARFSTRLQTLITDRGMTVKQVADMAQTNVQCIRRLISGTEPRLDMKTLIERLEDGLGSSRGALWNLISAPRMRVPFDAVYTAEKARDLEKVGVHSGFLPEGWEDLEHADKEAVIAWIDAVCVRGTPWRRLQRAKRGAYGTLPRVMGQEFERLARFKTATIPSEPGILRKKKAVSSRFGDRLQHGGKWKSAALGHTYVLKTFSVAKDLCSDPGSKWFEISGLGFLINPELQEHVCREIARRRFIWADQTNAFQDLDFAPPEDGLIYSDADLARLEILMGLFSPHTGYLYHRPSTLVPIPGLIGMEWCRAANADWRAVAKASLEMLRELVDNIRAAARKIRDPWLPIEPLMESDRPLAPLFQAVDQMAAKRPSFFGTPLIAARHDRDHFLIRLLLNSRLRRANYAKLTWRQNGTGNLRWDMGRRRWKLVIPQRLLKNAGARSLPNNGADLVLVLDPKDRNLYLAVERWIGVVDPETGIVDEFGSSRRLLCGPDCGDAVFPGGGPRGSLSEQTISAIVYRFSAMYLVQRPWSELGVPGVMPFGSHAIRHLVAMHVLRTTRSAAQAAAALFDCVETVERHYARLKSETQSEHTNDIIWETTRA